MSDMEPTNRDLARQIDEGFRTDARLRAVEQEVAALRLLPKEIQRMEDRLVAAIEAVKPKSPWPAVGALAGVVSVFLVVAAAIFTRA